MWKNSRYKACCWLSPPASSSANSSRADRQIQLMASIQRLIRLGALLAVNPAALVEDAAAAARRTVILIVCALVAGTILLPGVGCLMAALWIFVQHRLGPVWAGVITAAAVFLLAIVILVIGLIQSKNPNRDRRAAPRRGYRADPA